MNLLGIQQECGRLLSDKNNDRWTADVLTTRANLAQTEIQGYTSAVKRSELLTLFATTSAYTVTAGTMNVLKATITDSAGVIKPFDGVNLEELDFLYSDWRSWTPGAPRIWWFDATSGAITVAPTPDTNSGWNIGDIIANDNKKMTVYESRKPSDLAASGDIPFDGFTPMIPYHIAIVHWVVAQCFMDDGTPEALAKSSFHKSGNILRPGLYEKQLSRIMSEFDVEEAIPTHILWQKQGGRLGSNFYPSKSNPLW